MSSKTYRDGLPLVAHASISSERDESNVAGPSRIPIR